MASPPKPWERPGSAAGASTSSAPSTSSINAQTTSSTTTPSIPDRPAALTAAAQPSLATTTASPYNRVGGYGSGYGGMGGYGGYNSMSTYGGYGGYGGGYGGYGGLGGYGSTYGGYGGLGGYGGMPHGGPGSMYGPGMPGMDPNNPSFTQALESTTQQTFGLLHSIVQTFGGVAQMLESTYFATHSSFFALAGVVDQFGQLRNALGSVLGLFGLLKWMKELVTGRPSTQPMRSEFKEFINGKPVQGPAGPAGPRPSKKPLIFFLLAIFGVPFAMTKLVRAIAARQEQQAQLLPPLDPSELTFARSLYAFNPSTPAELALKEGEIVAIMGKLDAASGQEVDPRIECESEWWKGRTREGREGWFPKKWVEVIERKDKKVAA